VRFLAGVASPVPSVRESGEPCKLPQRGFGFWSILGPQKSHQNGQLTFESGATSESGDKCPPPCPNVEPPLRSCYPRPIPGIAGAVAAVGSRRHIRHGLGHRRKQDNWCWCTSWDCRCRIMATVAILVNRHCMCGEAVATVLPGDTQYPMTLPTRLDSRISVAAASATCKDTFSKARLCNPIHKIIHVLLLGSTNASEVTNFRRYIICILYMYYCQCWFILIILHIHLINQRYHINKLHVQHWVLRIPDKRPRDKRPPDKRPPRWIFTGEILLSTDQTILSARFAE